MSIFLSGVGAWGSLGCWCADWARLYHTALACSRSGRIRALWTLERYSGVRLIARPTQCLPVHWNTLWSLSLRACFDFRVQIRAYTGRCIECQIPSSSSWTMLSEVQCSFSLFCKRCAASMLLAWENEWVRGGLRSSWHENMCCRWRLGGRKGEHGDNSN